MMPIVRNLIVCLIYINSLSFALECTRNCYFSINFGDPFEIPARCNETGPARLCQVDMSVSHNFNYIFFSFSTFTYNIPGDDTHNVWIQLADDGSLSVSSGVTRYCNKKDDCARELASSSMHELFNHPSIDSRALKAELSPLLSSNFSTGNPDVACFDSNEKVQQCAIATKPGACNVFQQLTGRKTITRTCDSKQIIQSQYISIYDSGKSASFSLACNRSLCNGPMTIAAVKEVIFKYNITKTIDGRLNHGLRLSLSYPILILLISLFIS